MQPPVVGWIQSYGAGLWAGLVWSIPLKVAIPTAALGLVLAGMGQGRWHARAGVAALGVMTGGLAARRDAHSCTRRWAPGPHAVTAVMGDRAGASGLTRTRVLGASERCGGQLPVRLGTHRPPAGATVVMVGWHAGRSTAFRVDHVRVLGSHRSWRYAARDYVARRFTTLYGRRAPLVHALTLGNRDDFDPALRRVFADAGLAHLLAISGLHVGLLAGWMVVVGGWLLGRARGWSAAAVGTWVYVAFLGFPAPATRAALFITVRAVTLCRQRNPSGPVVLHVAALGVLVADPGAVADVGAWLSFAAVWGTAEATQALPDRWRRHKVASLMASSVGATLATAPITAYVFGSVPLVGILANLVAVPLSAVAVPAVFASFVSHTLSGGAALTLAAIERVAVLAASVPGGSITATPSAAFAVPWALLVLALSRVKAVGGPRRPRLRGLAWAAATAWLVCGLPWGRLTAGWGSPPGRWLAIHVLDVGQGDGIVIRTPGGRWMVVDAGPRTPTHDAGRRVVLPFLKRQGVRQLDLLVVTHGDADHLGGVPAVERALSPALVLEPGQPLGTGLYLEHLAAVDGGGLPWFPARSGDTLWLDSVQVTVLHPTPEWMATQLEPNENSVVLRIRFRGFVAVLTGDAGHVTEERLLATVGRADVLKVGHHGSAGSTGDAWLAALRPRAAVISVGQNRYGHPDAGVLDRLRRQGVEAFRTDQGGAVTIRSDGSYFELTQGGPTSVLEALRCRVRILSPSSGSSSSRSACTPRRRASFPISSTTSPSPP
ncbi:MAG TPA: DNA internalization-related competence protein ComEC/Rec2, partial [Gemmatimonadales bacterium]|nr:DNA internalization-related competence protein ComEC/Rec2 [Gemmatimonadales bacterium]